MPPACTVAVCSRSFSRHPVLVDELRQRYPNARLNVQGRRLLGSELREFLTGASKMVLSACMILGRLEFLTVLAIFTPAFWRR